MKPQICAIDIKQVYTLNSDTIMTLRDKMTLKLYISNLPPPPPPAPPNKTNQTNKQAPQTKTKHTHKEQKAKPTHTTTITTLQNKSKQTNTNTKPTNMPVNQTTIKENNKQTANKLIKKQRRKKTTEAKTVDKA